MRIWNFTHILLFPALFAIAALHPGFAQEISSHAKLESFISYYEDGEYKKAADSLGALLPSVASGRDEMDAYKYLGFSFAMLNWVDKSKETFKTALKKFPRMDIDTLEVPPNIAIIFKQAKLERRLETIDTLSMRKPVVVVERRNVALPTVLLSISIVSAVVGAELFYNGFQQYQQYTSVNTPDQSVLDKYYSNARNAYIGGAACAVVTAVLVPVSLYLFLKKEPPAKKIKISFTNRGSSLVWLF
jgi:hypothetical protein